MVVTNVPIPLDSKAAFDCLGRLETRSFEEKRELVYLNDKFIDLIENVHFLEAENQVLLHDRNLLKTGIEGDNSGINHIFEVELTNIQLLVEEKYRSREHFENEASLLDTQVHDAYQRLQSLNTSNFGVPHDVDDELRRLSEIQAENTYILQKIRYMEDKNKKARGGLGGIQDTINLMRLRKDQAESLKHEFANRRNDLINSIHNMEAENKSIIMNEHKYFTRDRKVDQNAFRSQFRSEIDAIRQNYETLRIRSKEEINIRLQQRIRDLQSQVPDYKHIIIIELRQVRESIRVINAQISDTELKNTLVQNMIDNLRSESVENNKFFEISLAERDAETERLKMQCTQLAVEMEKLCDQQINLTAEIAKYRQLLDGFASVNTTTLAPVTIPQRSTTFSSSTTYDEQANVSTGTVIHHRDPYQNELTHSTTQRVITPLPSLPLSVPYVPSPVQSGSLHKTVVVETTGITTQPTVDVHQRTSLYDRYQNDLPSPGARSTSYYSSRRESGYNPYDHTRQHSLPPARPYQPTPIVERVTTPVFGPSVISAPIPASTPIRVPTPVNEASGTRIYQSEHARSESSARYEIEPRREYIPLPTITPAVREYSNTEYSTGYEHHQDQHSTYASQQQHHHHQDQHSNYGSQQQQQQHHQQHSQQQHHADHSRFASTVENVYTHDHTSPALRRENVGLSFTKDEESIDLDNVQRFTRWYKGRVKISDVTPDFIILENRSARKRANIGGFKLIHQTGFKSVFLDFPTNLILEPKDSLKIYARKSDHPHGSLIVEIDEFDTTTLSDTSLRNHSDEVKTWFKYVTNTEHDRQV